jgi:SynChlorMet cassette radical SAM/SPASM protein ScmE
LVPGNPGYAHLPDTPRSVEIAITGRCNLGCSYCFYADEMSAADDLPAEIWMELFAELGRLGVMRVILSGGEPFVRRDLFDLIDGIIGNRMRYSILTNGTLLDETVAGMMKTGKRLKRLDGIQISLDGSTADINDLSRPGGFSGAVSGIRLLVDSGIPVTARVTINRFNIENLEDLAALLLDDIGLDSFSTGQAAPIGAGCGSGTRITIDPPLVLRAARILERLVRKYPGRITSQAGPLVSLRSFRKMEQVRNGSEASGTGVGRLTACGCFRESLGILHDGSVVPCHMLYSLKLGTIGTDDIGTIWRSHPVLSRLRSRTDVSMHGLAECRGCRWTEACNGGCPALPVQNGGNFFSPDSAGCFRTFLETLGIDSLSELESGTVSDGSE